MIVQNIFKVDLNKDSFVNQNEDYLIEFLIYGEGNSYANNRACDDIKGYFLLNNNILLEATEVFNISNSIEKIISTSDYRNLNIDGELLMETISKLNSNLSIYSRTISLVKELKTEISFISNNIYDVLLKKYNVDNLEDWFTLLVDEDIELDINSFGFDLIKDYKHNLKENEKSHNEIHESVLLLINFKNNSAS